MSSRLICDVIYGKEGRWTRRITAAASITGRISYDTGVQALSNDFDTHKLPRSLAQAAAWCKRDELPPGNAGVQSLILKAFKCINLPDGDWKYIQSAWVEPDPQEVAADILAFMERSSKEEYMDTGEALELLEQARRALL